MLRMLAFIVCVFALYYSVSSGNAAQADQSEPVAQAGPATPTFVSGEVDDVFVQGMLVHHQSAIAMAKVELQNGADPELRLLAARIMAAQTADVALLKQWLAKHGR